MCHCMLQGNFKPQTWESFIAKPTDRTSAVRAELEKLGGRLDRLFYTSGDYDVVVIYEARDESEAALLARSIASTAGLETAVNRVALLTPEQALTAMAETDEDLSRRAQLVS